MQPPLKIIFAGTPDFAATALQAILTTEHELVTVLTQPDRPAGRGRKLSPGPVKALAVSRGLTVYQPVSLKAADVQAKLRELNADLMVVVAYGLILPAQILTMPRYGCINIHASLLPRWRGAAPIQRAILAGDDETGITIIQMDEGLDTGDMLLEVPCTIRSDDTAATLHDRLASMGADSILKAIDLIASQKTTPTKQCDELSTYAPKIEKDEARINWDDAAVDIDRMVRAFNPFPVAFTFLSDGSRLRIWQTELVSGNESSKPGTVISVGDNGIDVATGEGVIRLLTIQAAGRRAMAVKDFQNASDIDVGTVFGDL
ncbi:MAG: methionyl-tRNA formyltransferase [Gammaproteobacteria bacterium]